MANSKISVENLNLHYGENHALKDVNMEIADHAITAFIGPSGCGKSTFLRCLNRMNDLVDGCRVEGKVILDGEDIYDKRVDTTLLRKKVGMVFQQPNPFPMSIYDNIAYGPRLHGIKNKKELDEIVERSLQGAAIFEEVKDRLHKSALGLFAVFFSGVLFLIGIVFLAVVFSGIFFLVPIVTILYVFFPVTVRTFCMVK